MAREVPDFPEQTRLDPPTGPTAHVKGSIPPHVFGARSQVVKPNLESNRANLYCYVQHMHVGHAPPGPTFLESARNGISWSAQDTEPEPTTYTPVIIRATLSSGASVAIRVVDWKPKVWILLDEAVAANPTRFIHTLQQECKCSLLTTLVRRFRAYGYHPEKNSGHRKRFPFLCVQAPTQRALRRLQFAFKNFAKTNSPWAKRTSLEEDRIPLQIKFQDERHIPPASWCVLPASKYKILRDEDRFSFASVNIETSYKHILGLARAQSISQDNRFDDGPSKETIPPSLFAYADIECKSQSTDEFPDPTHPNAPLYMIGVSFAWSFQVPPALVQARAPPPRTQASFSLDHVRQRRSERRALRQSRIAAYKNDSTVRRILGSTEELVSDDESDGSDVEDRRERESFAQKEQDAEKFHNAQYQARAWPRGSTQTTWRGTEDGGTFPEDEPGVVEGAPFLRVLFVWGSCDPIPGAVVVECSSEASVMEQFRNVVVGLMDVDGIRGYNWLGFDTTYMARRAELLNRSRELLNLTHTPQAAFEYDKTPYQLTLQGGRFQLTRMMGTNTVDMYSFMRQTINASSYKLDAIAQEYGVEGKHPVTPQHIFQAFGGTSGQRASVGAYCVQDCDVLVHVAQKSFFEITIKQFALVMRTPEELMWASGQQLRIICQLVWKAHRNSFVLDGMYRRALDVAGGTACPGGVVFTSDGESCQVLCRNVNGTFSVRTPHAIEHAARLDMGVKPLPNKKRFEGGFVMTPIRGFYDTPTCTLDYKSLYPSIIISHNLCYSTALLSDQDTPHARARIAQAGLEIVDVETSAGTFGFVQAPDTLLPAVERDMWSGRQQLKRDMKQTTDPTKYVVLDKRQLGMKQSMNSAFGGTGAKFALLPMIRISHTITHIGRTTVQAAKEFANNLHTLTTDDGVELLDGTPPRTVYGDTDSIMVNMPTPTASYIHHLRRLRANVKLGIHKDDGSPPTRSETLLHAEQVAFAIVQRLNQTYRKPMELEYEEAAVRAIFINPKMYVKALIEGSNDTTLQAMAQDCPVGKLKPAGIAAVRRDRCGFARNLQRDVADCIVRKGDEERGVQLMKRRMVRMALGLVDKDELTVTTELRNNKPTETVASPHVAVAWAMEKIMPGSEPKRGQRVPWMMVQSRDPTRLIPPSSKQVKPSSRTSRGSKQIALAEYARHPDEVCPQDKIHVRYYIDQQLMRSLELLFRVPRPDLFQELQSLRRDIRPLIESSEGKKRTRTILEMLQPAEKRQKT